MCPEADSGQGPLRAVTRLSLEEVSPTGSSRAKTVQSTYKNLCRYSGRWAPALR